MQQRNMDVRLLDIVLFIRLLLTQAGILRHCKTALLALQVVVLWALMQVYLQD
jgi:hypothetical protein